MTSYSIDSARVEWHGVLVRDESARLKLGYFSVASDNLSVPCLVLLWLNAGFAYDYGILGARNWFVRLFSAQRNLKKPIVAPIKEVEELAFRRRGKNVADCLCVDQFVVVVKILSLATSVGSG